MLRRSDDTEEFLEGDGQFRNINVLKSKNTYGEENHMGFVKYKPDLHVALHIRLI